MTDDEFHTHWLNVHGKIAKKLCARQGVVCYVQSHTLDTALNTGIRESRGLREGFDGIAELWWESEAAVEADLANEDLVADFEELWKDEACMIDYSRSCAFFTQEFTLYEGNS